jgi:hypothetical protein
MSKSYRSTEKRNKFTSNQHHEVRKDRIARGPIEAHAGLPTPTRTLNWQSLGFFTTRSHFLGSVLCSNLDATEPCDDGCLRN